MALNIRNDELTPLAGRTFLITGADGMLGRAYQEVLREDVPSAVVHAADRSSLDVCDRPSVLARADLRPDFVIHCAANVDADRCERQPEECRRTQVDGTRNVVDLALACGARLFYPQSFLIFDGKELPVTEVTAPVPTFAYGRYKLASEELVLERAPEALVVRMAGFFGGDEKDKNFVGKFARELRRMVSEGVETCVVGPRVWQPTYTVDLARNALLLQARGCSGIYLMGSKGEASFFDVACAMVEELGLGGTVRVSPGEVKLDEPASRPMRIVMATHRLDREGLNRQRAWRVALREYLQRPFFDDLRVR